MAMDFEDSLKEFLNDEKNEKGAGWYSTKDHVELYHVQSALDTALNDVKDEITDMTMPTNKNPMTWHSVTNSFSFKYKGNKIEISKKKDLDSSTFYYSINGGSNHILAKDNWGGFAGQGDFKEGMLTLLEKMKKI